MAAGSERRTSMRVPCDATVSLDTFGIVAPRVERSGLPGRCADRSADEGGIGFETPQPLFTGQAVRLAEGGRVRDAVVRWVGTTAAGYRVGAAFVR